MWLLLLLERHFDCGLRNVAQIHDLFLRVNGGDGDGGKMNRRGATDGRPDMPSWRGPIKEWSGHMRYLAAPGTPAVAWLLISKDSLVNPDERI